MIHQAYPYLSCITVLMLLAAIGTGFSGRCVAASPNVKPSTKVANHFLPLTSPPWVTVYDGYGRIAYLGSHGILLAPKAATQRDESHAALALLADPRARNFRLRITAVTTRQLREGTPPATWEVFWIFFNYNPTAEGKVTNYFLLKPNGVELGIAHREEDQTFLYTAPVDAELANRAIGASNTYEIKKTGQHVTVVINGKLTVNFHGEVLDIPGQIGLYTEDADVLVTKVQVIPLP